MLTERCYNKELCILIYFASRVASLVLVVHSDSERFVSVWLLVCKRRFVLQRVRLHRVRDGAGRAGRRHLHEPVRPRRPVPARRKGLFIFHFARTRRASVWSHVGVVVAETPPSPLIPSLARQQNQCTIHFSRRRCNDVERMLNWHPSLPAERPLR